MVRCAELAVSITTLKLLSSKSLKLKDLIKSIRDNLSRCEAMLEAVDAEREILLRRLDNGGRLVA